MNGALDSTGTGIISLSETFSKITFEKPNNLKIGNRFESKRKR
jgi:hypothetical protein